MTLVAPFERASFSIHPPKAFTLLHSMALNVAAIASGSNGNCYYIGNEHEAVLIDAGISCREIEKRMKRLNLPLKKLKAVFVSHEHGDHIRGLEGLSKKHQLPIYISTDTLRFSKLNLEDHLVRSFSTTSFTIGDLTITPFTKTHDAADPYSFTISQNEICVGVITDIGTACENVINHFKKCNAVFLESNYDTEMLDNGKYPYFLKQRISGGKGHISNAEALELFRKHKSPFMSHLFLSHLSKNNNCPQLVKDLFDAHAEETQIIVASRFEETALYKISGAPVLPAQTPSFAARQMELSF